MIKLIHGGGMVTDLIEQTIAQHIIAPKVLSYAPSKLNEVTGRFVSANRVYNFVLNKQGVSYSPAGQGDSLLFSALYLRQDAVRKPKIGNDKCNAGRSYQCGKICLGNRRKCHKGVRDVNDARRIASILESTNRKLESDVAGDVSDKAIARGRALFEARGNRAAKPKGVEIKRNSVNAPSKKKDVRTVRDVVLMAASLEKDQEVNNNVLPEDVADYLGSTGLLKKKDKKMFLASIKDSKALDKVFKDFPEFESPFKEELKNSAEAKKELQQRQETKQRQGSELKDRRDKNRELYGVQNKKTVATANELADKNDLYVPTQTKIFYIKDHPLIADYDGAEIKQVVNGKKTSLTPDQLAFVQNAIKDAESKENPTKKTATKNKPSKPKPTKAKPKINVQLMDTFVDEIKLKDGEAKPPQKNIDEAARLLKELGGRVSIPLMTEEKSGKVIGNSLLYHAAKKAGIERLWTVQGKDVDPDIEERLEKLNTDHGKSSSVSDAIQNGTTRKNQLMQDVRNYEIVQDDVKYPTKALDEAAKLLKEQGTNISPIILMEFGEGKTTFNGREVKHPQYKVIGNSFIYEAAKRAGMGEDEGIWNIKVNNKKDAELVQRLLELTKNN